MYMYADGLITGWKTKSGFLSLSAARTFDTAAGGGRRRGRRGHDLGDLGVLLLLRMFLLLGIDAVRPVRRRGGETTCKIQSQGEGRGDDGCDK